MNRDKDDREQTEHERSLLQTYDEPFVSEARKPMREVRCLCEHGVQAHANSQTECNGCTCNQFRLEYLSALPG